MLELSFPSLLLVINCLPPVSHNPSTLVCVMMTVVPYLTIRERDISYNILHTYVPANSENVK